MIAKKDKEIILHCARKYGASSIILFGSSLAKSRGAQDIDLGVKGIEPRRFFKFYAELYKLLSKPVDLIDLDRENRFSRQIEETGIRIYG